MDVNDAQKRIEKILMSWALSEEKPQLAEAFVDVLDQVPPEDRFWLVQMIITNFDKSKPHTGGDYQFGSKWSDERWRSAVGAIRGLKQQLNKVLIESRGNINAFVAAVLKKMYNSETMHDMRVAIVSGIIFSEDFCPFNYFRSNINATEKEYNVIKQEPGVVQRLQAFIEDNTRFVTSVERAAYLQALMNDRTQQDQVIILDLILQVCELKDKLKKGPPSNPTNALIALALLDKVIRESPGGECGCENCKRARSARNN